MANRASLLRHIVFPREMAAQRVVNVAMQPAVSWLTEREASLPQAEGDFLAWLFAQAGLCAADYRSETLLRRLPACLRLLHVGSLAEARLVLERTPTLVSAAMDVMLVGVTSFFRDEAVFRQLSEQWLPRLAEPRGGVYVWSVGCSDGPELYSMAILLSELGLLDHSYLLGTDCRSEAIERVREATYSESALAGVPAGLRERYFVRVDQRWRVSDSLRRCVRARQANILDHGEPGLWDVILCRNTSIYLRSSASHRLWSRLEASLRHGGILVLGKSERPLSAQRLQCQAQCIYRKVGR